MPRDDNGLGTAGLVGEAQHRVPRHIGLIMDGNGRWATSRGLPRVAGHEAGIDALHRTLRAAGELGVEVLTVYAFSEDNWKRPRAEVRALMRLLERGLRDELKKLDDNGVRVTAIGRRDRLERHLVRAIADAEAQTARHNNIHLRVAIDYSSRGVLARAAEAARRLPADVSLDRDLFDRMIASEQGPDVPPLDLLIRTSGEQRLSDFLLWEVAYAELYFTPVLWPDFSAGDLVDAITTYNNRDRRFGALPDTPRAAEVAA